MSSALEEQPGARIYRPWLLKIYNWWVLGVSNSLAWRCSSNHLLKIYNDNVGATHMDVGVGTGWYLARCKFPSTSPSITLVDLSPDSLKTAGHVIQHLKPTLVEADILKQLPSLNHNFDSISLNYLLHCLPLSLKEKLPKVLSHLVPHLKPTGVLFGSTILGQGVRHNFFGKKLMSIYNKKGFFSNDGDRLIDLDQILRQYFDTVDIEMVGVVAIFVAKNPRR